MEKPLLPTTRAGARRPGFRRGLMAVGLGLPLAALAAAPAQAQFFQVFEQMLNASQQQRQAQQQQQQMQMQMQATQAQHAAQAPDDQGGIYLNRMIQARAVSQATLRAEPGGGASAGSIPAKAAVSVIEGRDGWYHVERNGVRGWVPHDAVTVDMSTMALGVPVRAKVVSNVTVRRGPGTNHAALGSAKAGADAVARSSDGRWYMVTAQVGDAVRTGWVRNDFIALEIGEHHRVIEADSKKVGLNSDFMNNPLRGGERRVVYAGYSEGYREIKEALRLGKFEEAATRFDEMTAPAPAPETQPAAGATQVSAAADPQATPTEAAPAPSRLTTDSFLSRVEMGTLALDAGKAEMAVEALADAEYALVERRLGSTVGRAAEDAVGFLAGFLSGNEETQEYVGLGYERILMLNYKAMAYLLDGDRRAYNVTRRAIDWQNIEKRRFEEALRKEQKTVDQADSGSAGEGGSGTSKGTVDSMFSQFDSLNARAASVPNAYVNPFGYYVAGLVQELEAEQDPSLRDNARISYQKALELNPDSAVLREALSDLERPVAGQGRLVHILAADGLAPERKAVVYGLPLDRANVAPIKMSYLDPVASEVRRIEVRGPDGQVLTVLSPLADVEAIALRHQKDGEAVERARMLLAVARTIGERSLLGGLGVFGQIISNIRDSTSNPDMRSWASLPSAVLAARLRVPERINTLKVVSIGTGGKVLASRTISLKGRGDAVVYARSLDKNLKVHLSERLWTSAPAS